MTTIVQAVRVIMNPYSALPLAAVFWKLRIETNKDQMGTSQPAGVFGRHRWRVRRIYIAGSFQLTQVYSSDCLPLY